MREGEFVWGRIVRTDTGNAVAHSYGLCYENGIYVVGSRTHHFPTNHFKIFPVNFLKKRLSFRLNIAADSVVIKKVDYMRPMERFPIIEDIEEFMKAIYQPHLAISPHLPGGIRIPTHNHRFEIFEYADDYPDV